MSTKRAVLHIHENDGAYTMRTSGDLDESTFACTAIVALAEYVRSHNHDTGVAISKAGYLADLLLREVSKGV